MGPLTKLRISLSHALLANTGSEMGPNPNPAKPRRSSRLKEFRWGKNKKPDNVKSDLVFLDTRKNAQKLPDNSSGLSTPRNWEKAQELPNKGTEDGHNAVENWAIAQQLYNNTSERMHQEELKGKKQVNGKKNQPLEATTKQEAKILPPELQRLQRLGFDITPSGPDCKAIIVQAAGSGWADILEYFLAPERRPCIPDLQNTLDIALHNATKRGFYSVIQLLLDLGADSNFKGRYGRTALHNAARGGFEDIVRLLLDKKAKIRVTDENGKTPLHLAGDQGHEAVFLMMHMELHGDLSHVRREADIWIPSNLPPGPQGRLGAYEYALPGGPADPRPVGRHAVFYHPCAERW
jgi:hypothetical protein